MLVWGVLSFLFLVSMLIIGMRRWEGWMFASLTNVGWIIYSLVDGVRVVELIFSVAGSRPHRHLLAEVEQGPEGQGRGCAR